LTEIESRELRRIFETEKGKWRVMEKTA